MTDFGKNFDPESLSRRYKRNLGADQSSPQHGQNSPPNRWTRVTSAGRKKSGQGAPQQISRGHLTRRRWQLAMIGAVVVLLGVFIAAYCLGFDFFGLVARNAAEKEANVKATTSADSGNPDLKGADGPASESKSGGIVTGRDSKPADLSELQKMVTPALVTIRRHNSRGTGFVIEGGLVVTAYHVCPLDAEATVVYDSGEQAPVTAHVAYDDLRDVAILQTRCEGHPLALKLASSLPAKGTLIASFKPGDGEIQGTMIEVETHETLGTGTKVEMLRSTLNAVPGWSGGPVVNMRGEVVGLNCRLDGSLFDAKFLKIATGSAAAPVTAVNRLLQIVNLSVKITSQPNNAKYRQERAALYTAKGEYSKAIDDYTELLKLKPENADAYFQRGTAYAKDYQPEKSIADFTSAIQRRKDFIDAYIARAAIYDGKHDRDGAIGDYLALLRLLPEEKARPFEEKLVENYKGRASARAIVGKYDGAVADLSEVLHLRHGSIEALAARAQLHFNLGRSDKAIADYTEAIRLKPDSAELYRRRGFVYTDNGEHDKALQDLSEAIRLDPKNAEAYCTRGAVYGARHQQDKAIADFTSAIELDPSLGRAYFDRGMAYKAMGKLAEAERDLQRAREHNYRPE
jgi:tetratricopeptide (TPR) repeat protein